MANAKEIQARMKSIQDTMKITNAMYMISSSKMKRAKQVLADTEPYFYNMQNAVSRILRHMPDVDHVFFDTRPHIEIQDRKIGCIVVTADKGLAGAYNHNVIKMTEEMVQEKAITSCMCSVLWGSSISGRRMWTWMSSSIIRFRSLPCTERG